MKHYFHDLYSLKSQLVRKKDTLYTLRTDGFFLKKSGVSRLGRSSLKWSRSMQRRSKVVNKVDGEQNLLLDFKFSAHIWALELFVTWLLCL